MAGRNDGWGRDPRHSTEKPGKVATRVTRLRHGCLESNSHRTRLFVSDDPFRFDSAGQVGTIDAHAAEIVVDEGGQTWVSHCGWGQGGVYLAPLYWGGP
jgi:hypothetical protein